jgi:hypothetical protein
MVLADKTKFEGLPQRAASLRQADAVDADDYRSKVPRPCRGRPNESPIAELASARRENTVDGAIAR